MKTDTRFYPGYIWCYTENPMLGLCIAGTDERQCAEKTVNKAYYNKGRKHIVYTMTSPESVPTRHEITV